MTISNYVVNFLKSYENLAIETNHLKDGSDKYGLFKSPSRDIVSMNDASYQVTEYYEFMAKQPSTSDNDRTDSDEWLEKLTYLVDDFEIDNNYPTIDGNRMVTNISLTGCPYPMDSDDSEVTYQISLTITYIREREVL